LLLLDVFHAHAVEELSRVGRAYLLLLRDELGRRQQVRQVVMKKEVWVDRYIDWDVWTCYWALHQQLLVSIIHPNSFNVLTWILFITFPFSFLRFWLFFLFLHWFLHNYLCSRR